MSHATTSGTNPIQRKRFLADSFSKSVGLMAFLMILQRGVGFLRSFYVCGSLTPAEVGRWDLSFSFLMLMAPLAVLGIPSSFGRYVSRYERQGAESRFLRVTMLACLGLVLLFSIGIWLCDGIVARVFFGGVQDVNLVRLLAIGLPLVTFFNFASCWFAGKRLNRFVFRIQFAQTLFFALLCVVMFQLTSITAVAVVSAYLLSCLFGVALSASYVVVSSRSSNASDKVDESSPVWRSIMPFAVWIWISDAILNLFSVCDRLLLVNFYGKAEQEIQYMIGQYHTACLFPLLLMSIGSMAGSTGMPYLSKDWEEDNRAAVADRMNLMLKAIGLLCMCASIGILVFAPILFGELWKDKFYLGESLLPMALCFCSLAAMTVVAEKYFWCIEKTWISSCFLLLGLIVNFSVGWLLVGRFGIEGVVTSTLLAHAIVLLGVLAVCRRYELRLDRGVFLISGSLLALCIGKGVALVVFSVVLAMAIGTPMIFSNELRYRVFDRVRSVLLARRG